MRPARLTSSATKTSGNEDAGIARIRSAALTARNRTSTNGSGIVSEDSHGLFVRNVTNANAGHGLSIFDGIETHGPLHTVQDQAAMANGGLGISSNVRSVF